MKNKIEFTIATCLQQFYWDGSEYFIQSYEFIYLAQDFFLILSFLLLLLFLNSVL